MSQVTRSVEIRRRQKRRATIKLNRAKLADKKTSSAAKEKALTKLRKVAPWIPDREWVSPSQTGHFHKVEDAETPKPRPVAS